MEVTHTLSHGKAWPAVQLSWSGRWVRAAAERRVGWAEASERAPRTPDFVL